MRKPVTQLAFAADFGAFAHSRFVSGRGKRMSWLRRLLLEQWAIFLIACAAGFMGPFGTYLRGSLFYRVGHWWVILLGAYLLLRPAILGLEIVARRIGLPPTQVVFWGVVLSCLPLAALWRFVGQDEFRSLSGFSGVIPFALLAAMTVLAVSRWAANLKVPVQPAPGERPTGPPLTIDADEARVTEPPLIRRLPGFQGPILALQSEDHYVRVHGPHTSALVLLRLRDAIAEMGQLAGEQVHRSWWVASDHVASVTSDGRSYSVVMSNGMTVPVARGSAERLRQAGLLE
jgi:hypothetical protein